MESSYMRNAFTIAGKTPHSIESSTLVNFNPLLAIYCPLPVRKASPFQHIDVEAFFRLSLDDGYLDSTSPYDDDGC
jgi:hypothetical protein